jgi:hypothetical protein
MVVDSARPEAMGDASHWQWLRLYFGPFVGSMQVEWNP